jgi:hypothetical protein
MPLEKEIQKTCLLKYKFLFEENKRIKTETSQGHADLGAHLNEFRNKLSKKDVSQIKNFDKTFFPRDESKISCEFEAPEPEDGPVKIKNNNKKPDWFKKLFREIVFMTHPDKIGNFPIVAIVEKYKLIYLAATNAYENDVYSNILMIANDLDLDLPAKQVEEFILPKISVLNSQVETAKEIIGYQWYHIADDQKEILLSNYLKQLGFIFSKDEVKEVISRRSNRKVGNRPIKNTRKKLE